MVPGRGALADEYVDVDDKKSKDAKGATYRGGYCT
jgi:hypothetical protein